MKKTKANKKKVLNKGVKKQHKLTKTIAKELGYHSKREICSVSSILHWAWERREISKNKTKEGTYWWK